MVSVLWPLIPSWNAFFGSIGHTLFSLYIQAVAVYDRSSFLFDGKPIILMNHCLQTTMNDMSLLTFHWVCHSGLLSYDINFWILKHGIIILFFWRGLENTAFVQRKRRVITKIQQIRKKNQRKLMLFTGSWISSCVIPLLASSKGTSKGM